MNNVSGVSFSARVADNSGNERIKKVENTFQNINLALTGVGALGIAGTALVAKKIANHAGENPEGYTAKTGKAIKKPFAYLAEKTGPTFSKFFAENKVGTKIADASKYIAENAKSLHKSTPTAVKIAAGAAAGALALLHYYVKGQINGALAVIPAAHDFALDHSDKAYQTGVMHGIHAAHTANLQNETLNTLDKLDKIEEAKETLTKEEKTEES